MHQDDLPAGTWRGLGWAAVGLLAAAVLGIGLISAGVFDPQPIGRAQQSVLLNKQAVAAGERVVVWRPDVALPANDFTVRLKAAWAEGSQNVLYGVVLGDEEAFLAAAVSPLGYVAIWQQTGGNTHAILPLQTWPHVHGGMDENELQVDVAAESVTVRVNRELLWQGEIGVTGERVGTVVESLDEGSVVAFQGLQVFCK